MENGSCNTILVVDDTKLIRSFLKNILDTHELGSEFAVDGRDAVNKWEEGKFGAILMDIEMPVMNGLDASRTIRRREREEKREYTPIIGFSGNIAKDIPRKCYLAGMDAFIPKPIHIKDFLEVILSFVEAGTETRTGKSEKAGTSC